MSKKLKIIIACAVVAIIGLIFLFPKISLYFDGNTQTVNNSETSFFIKKEMDLKELAELLKQQGVIDDLEAFIAVGEYKGLTKNNIALGKYTIAPGTKYRNLLNGFKKNSSGNGNAEVEVSIIFTNCVNIKDIASRVSEKTMLKESELLAFLEDEKTTRKYNFTPEEFPAMFIPNTYKMYYDVTAQEFVERMAKEFKKFWTADRKAKLNAIGLKGESEAVTLASIVYAEQNLVADEWPIIAAVYLNRIEKGMKLESCPTVRFCDPIGIPSQPYEKDILRVKDCLYNTYTHKGLPPGPINIPSTKVVDAVLNPVDKEYIFMCAKPDNTHRHNFADDYATHSKNSALFNNYLNSLRR
jgi:UPF0755 protein